jgi:hypothetical protein
MNRGFHATITRGILVWSFEPASLSVHFIRWFFRMGALPLAGLGILSVSVFAIALFILAYGVLLSGLIANRIFLQSEVDGFQAGGNCPYRHSHDRALPLARI